MRQGDFGMEHWQKMYFISIKAHDKTLECNVDVRIMQHVGSKLFLWAIVRFSVRFFFL